MESNKNDFDEEISKRKAERGIENMEFIYQQLQNTEQAEEEEEEDKKNEKK